MMEIANVVASTSIQSALNRGILVCLNTGFGRIRSVSCRPSEVKIQTRELNTRVTVDPDDILVLGGIYESKEQNIRVGIPGLSSIP